MPWEETEQYIRSGHRDMGDFLSGSIRTIVISEDEGIKAVVGKPKSGGGMEIVSFLFDKGKGWTLEKAKEWFMEHGDERLSPVRESVRVYSPFRVLERVLDKPLRIRGVAARVGMSRNMNIYAPEELEAFAERLRGAPVYVEHVAVPNAVGRVVEAEFDGERVWYEAEIYDEELAEKIRRGLIQHVSIGADYETLELVNGRIPRGLHNAELSLVAVPGFPEANIQVLERLMAAEDSGHAPESPSQPSGVAEKLEKNEKNEKSEKSEIYEKSVENVQRLLTERVWTRRYINDLPDSAFALILPGGEKDEEGKTVPRSLRKFPYRRRDGSIDLPHLRNANARIGAMLAGSLPRGELTEEQLRQAQRVLAGHKKRLGIGMAAEEAKLAEQISLDEVEPVPAAPEPTIDEVIGSVEDAFEEIYNRLDELEARIAKLEASEEQQEPEAEETGNSFENGESEASNGADEGSPAGNEVVEESKEVSGSPGKPKDVSESLIKQTEPMMPVREAIQRLEACLPPPMVERSRLGEQLHCQTIRRQIWEVKQKYGLL
ncbi:hypothetical protein H5T51_01765 [Candidatus Bathyarchaeota archaeon]|nr:hypothetical protein [Candidatus Bathyarchaeota archaeon]